MLTLLQLAITCGTFVVLATNVYVVIAVREGGGEGEGLHGEY